MIDIKKTTVFDIASITKPVATALSIMILHEKGLLNINDRVGDSLTKLKNSPLGPKTIKALLTHTTGLPAWHPTYLIPEPKRLEHIASLVMSEQKVIYSCLGYLILGKIIESVSHTRLYDFFNNNIAGKLGLHTIQFGPIQEKDNVAATEHGSMHEQEMASKYGDTSSVKWRTYLTKGEVHDGNAFHGFQGVAGNAGLFSNIEDLAAFTRSYLSGHIVSKSNVEIMIADHTGGEEKRGLGWRIDPYPGILSPASFGHTGFTGTLLLVDPEQDLIIILLANAIHPKVQLGLMNPIRERVVRIIAKTLDNG
jgi:CubicO group peptidase (beta-lactamase class C family)